MRDLRDYLEVPQLTKVVNWLTEKQGVYNQTYESCVYKYDKIDSEMIDTVLIDNKKEMAMNKLELEIKELRERTGDNYMLNKMVNTDGVEFFAEYTLYKDYNKYLSHTLSGTSINIVDIMEEEFAEFLYHYRLSTIYPQVGAAHEDTWNITSEENEAIKEQMESGKTDGFVPVYDENDIEKQLVVDSKYDMTTDSFSESYLKGPEMWTETPSNTNPYYVEPWTSGTVSVGSGTISVGSGIMSITPETSYIDGTGNKSDQEKLAESVKFIKSLLEQVETKDSSTTPKNTENKSGITKIISDIIEELLTKGTCSINITLKQD